ncbi:hypothetical protein G6F68_016422 [Rhizopus microsporus]|nr:hypothetical protein G6F68_016422 [Rhizopus microsporus]
MARGQWQLVITELPPGPSGQKVLEEIEEITNPKVKSGKKSLTPEQTQAKAVMLNLLDAVRDESGKDAAVRLVFEPKTSRQLVDQPGVHRHRRPAAPEGPARHPGRVGGVPHQYRGAPHALPPGQGHRPHPRAGRPHAGLPERGRSHPDHPRIGRAARRADGTLQAVRTPGRRHPGNALAPIGPS